MKSNSKADLKMLITSDPVFVLSWDPGLFNSAENKTDRGKKINFNLNRVCTAKRKGWVLNAEVFSRMQIIKKPLFHGILSFFRMLVYVVRKD